MNELIEKVENLKLSLDKDKRVLDLKQAKKEVLKEKNLLEDIEKYKRTKKKEALEKIKSNEKFREYKRKETDCNLLIMEINQQLKEINNKGRNCHENN